MDDPTDGAGIDAPNTVAGLEDLRLHLKLDVLRGIFGYDGGRIDLDFALVPSMTFPLGNAVVEGSFMGDSFFTFHPKVALGAKIGRVRMGLNTGYLIVREKETYVATVGSRISYGAGAEVDIISDLSGIAELFGQQAPVANVASVPLEGAVAAKYRFGPGFAVTAGVGFGIVGGLGTPVVRAIAGITWTPPLFEDQDGDSVYDSKDKCPTEAEDSDGFEDSDGCPDPDNDADGIPDEEDKCALKAEDVDEFEDEDGCPDLDDDGDGVEDGYDACPRVAEDPDGFKDSDGCPDLDDDGDGIPDENDACKDKPEVFNGNEDRDGCPDEGEEIAFVGDVRIELAKPIEFKGKSARIKKRSLEVLNVIVTILDVYGEMRVRIEGHTYTSTSRRKNLKRSLNQAKSVLRYLVEQGIDPDRLEAAGHGADSPLDDSGGSSGRIEIHIIGVDDSNLDSDGE
ncbi:MAG: OmpA family protein [Proteobacteria bacterium]|nr:OmpA family protein [Pseudomonadota bacterium]